MLHLGIRVEELKNPSSSGRDISHRFMSLGLNWFLSLAGIWAGLESVPGLMGPAQSPVCLRALIGQLFTPASQFSLKCGRLMFLRPLCCVKEGSGVPQAQTDPGWGVWSQQCWAAAVPLGVVTVGAALLVCFWFLCFVFYFRTLLGFQLIFRFWNVFLHILVPKAVPYAVCDGVWLLCTWTIFYIFFGNTLVLNQIYFFKI